MIRITNGVYGGKDGMKRASDGPFTLSAEEEARLVKRGVAEYVATPDDPAPDPELEREQEPVLAPEEKAPVPDTEDDKTPHAGMTVKELREIAKERGVSFKVGMTKPEMVAAIMAAQNPPEPVEDEVTEEVTETEPDEDAPTFDAAEAVQ